MIFSGDELLRGDTLNTNQSYLGERLLDLGIFATHALCVTDDLQAMVDAIRDSLARRPVVLVLSGGLGPTEDDLTREAVAEALDRPLEHHEDLLEQIRARFASRGFVMGDSNRKQALIPRGAYGHPPRRAPRPASTCSTERPWWSPCPACPGSSSRCGKSTVEPLLRARRGARTGARGGQAVRRIRTFGIGESMLAEMLAEFDWHDPEATIGTRANLDGVTIILRGQASPEGERKLDAVQARVLRHPGRARLRRRRRGPARGRRRAAARGRPDRGGGRVVHGRPAWASASPTSPAAATTSSAASPPTTTRSRPRCWACPPDCWPQYGAVSEEVAAAMAEGVCRLLGADCALSTTGVAGPDGGSDEKPVGLVYIGSVVDGVTEVERLQLLGQRDQIRERAAFAALDLLRRRLLREASAR